MMAFKLNEQIALLRKKKGLTQEELAKALGVTNQSVSKWESSICCPDIQILPELARFFEVSIDELIGYMPENSFENVYLKVKALFEAAPMKDAFSIAFKLSALLHEGACTGGYKGYVPWDITKNHIATEDCYRWVSSICSEPEGVTIHKKNTVLISDYHITQSITQAELREIHSVMQNLCDMNTLKVLFGLYELTRKNYSLYIPLSTLIEKCKLTEEVIRTALDHLPTIIEEANDGEYTYRLEGSFMHIPAILLLLKNS